MNKLIRKYLLSLVFWHFFCSFEAEMHAKISQKCQANQSEEGFISKTFKFFDIHNKGQVNFEQFHRAVEKIGLVIEKQVSMLFIPIWNLILNHLGHWESIWVLR